MLCFVPESEDSLVDWQPLPSLEIDLRAELNPRPDAALNVVPNVLGGHWNPVMVVVMVVDRDEAMLRFEVGIAAIQVPKRGVVPQRTGTTRQKSDDFFGVRSDCVRSD